MKHRSRFYKTRRPLEKVDQSTKEDSFSVDKEILQLLAEAIVKSGLDTKSMNFGTLMGVIVDEVQRIDKENPTGPDEETDPRIVKLLKLGNELTMEMDPIIRENARNNPKALAEWDDIMQGVYKAEKEDADDSKT